MKYIVYKHTSPSGNVYIGQTCRINQRFGNNGINYKGSTLFWNAIQKCGWDNIKHEILFEGLTKEEADRIEIELIAKYKELGISYNLAPGGANFGTHWTDEQKQRASVAAKKRAQRPGESERRRAIKLAHPNSKEVCAKISAALKGPGNPMYGKHRSEEVKEKIRKKLLGRKASDETKQKIKARLKIFGHPMTGRRHTDETRKILSEKAKQRPKRYGYHLSDEVKLKLSGRRAIHKNGVCKKIRPEELESYLLDGWELGMK